MKAFGFLSLLVTLGICGYMMMGSFSGKPTADSELGQAQAAQGEEAQARAAMAQSSLAQLKTTVLSFQAAKGRLPNSLDELKQEGYIQTVPADVNYDPATGAVSSRQP